ncbi:hypothetical protein [Solibacillus sp. NPDC093137]|uniref:hypothetical protein n=1 Tax=Solibacillus sp. NPDC093137 TaxID=3390678 RepID=UPI003CFCEBC7
MRRINPYILMWHFITNNKILLGLSTLLFSINVFYLSNPIVNNSGDFVSQSHLLIIFGMVMSYLISYFTVLSMDSQLNDSLLEGYSSTQKIYKSVTFALISFFVILHTTIFFIFGLYYTFLFGPEVSIVKHTFVLYINYFFLSHFIPFMLGIYIALSTKKTGFIHRYMVPLLIIVIAVLVSEFHSFQELFSVFTINGKGYYNPFFGLTNYTHALITKIIILLFLICIMFFKLRLLSIKKKIFIYATLMIGVSFSLNFVATNYYQSDNEDFYTTSYVREFEKNGKPPETLPEAQNFSIKSYDIEIKDETKPVFTVGVAIQDIKYRNINFYLNETFKVLEVRSNSKRVPFKQQHNEIMVELNNTNNQTLTFTYQSNKGTALNPINNEYLFLPYFFNWLPSKDNTRDYYRYNDSSVEYNSHPDQCYGIKSVTSDIEDLIVLYSKENKCLTIAKGDFIKKNINSKTNIYLPKVWSGNIGSFENYFNYINAEVNLFNQTFNKEHSISSENIIFMPKYDAYSQPKFNDLWLQDSYQIILMDPFLNINENNLFLTLESISPFNVTYSFMRNIITPANQKEIETFSLLFTIYFFEKTDLSHEKWYLKYFIGMNKNQEVIDFLKLDLNQMEKQLILKYQSLNKERNHDSYRKYED